jgi:multidrug efflux pump subunit AcrA (membrane-fusion protein)
MIWALLHGLSALRVIEPGHPWVPNLGELALETLLRGMILSRTPRGFPPMNRSCCVVSALAFLSLASCSGGDAKPDEHVPSVTDAVAESVDLREEIRASGDLNARLHTTIAAEIEGRITQIAVDEGGSVKAGAVVIEIDPQRRRLELAAGRARLAQAQANFANAARQSERIRKLRSQNVASDQQLEEAETALTLARSRVEAERACARRDAARARRRQRHGAVRGHDRAALGAAGRVRADRASRSSSSSRSTRSRSCSA